MMNTLKNVVQKVVNRVGFMIISLYDPIIDQDEKFIKIYNKCKDYTMTSKARMYALYKTVEYIVKCDIPGDFVECGVWRGGSTMLIAEALLQNNVRDRKIWLYDTFSGMVKPKKEDFSFYITSNKIQEKWEKEQRKSNNKWCFASLSEVKSNMKRTGYPDDNFIYIKGKVEEAIPTQKPVKISLLRLDTDWYESTKHELKFLYPDLSQRGVLIVDDYGCWAGAKKAVDEYFVNASILINRIDDTGISCIKP